MPNTTTSAYDVAKHLRTPEEMAAYFDACLEEANGDAAFIAKSLGDIATLGLRLHTVAVQELGQPIREDRLCPCCFDEGRELPFRKGRVHGHCLFHRGS
jgi:hypothetical protein